MIILDVPHFLPSAPPAGQPKPANLPALPHGELEALIRFQPDHRLPTTDHLLPDTDSCQYQTSNDRPCPRPVIQYSDQEKPEDYCAAHLAWIEGVEDRFDLLCSGLLCWGAPAGALDLPIEIAGDRRDNRV